MIHEHRGMHLQAHNFRGPWTNVEPVVTGCAPLDTCKPSSFKIADAGPWRFIIPCIIPTESNASVTDACCAAATLDIGSTGILSIIFINVSLRCSPCSSHDDSISCADMDVNRLMRPELYSGLGS